MKMLRMKVQHLSLDWLNIIKIWNYEQEMIVRMYYDIIHFYNHFLYNKTKLSKYTDIQRQTNLLF